MAKSLRQSIPSQLGITDLSSGLLNTVLNPFWHANRNLYPYNEGGTRLSLRKTMESWEWPSTYTMSGYYPNDSGTPNWSDEGQGIAAGSNSWLFCSNDDALNPRVWRYALSADLDTAISVLIKQENYEEIPLDYKGIFNEVVHLGGADFFDGRLWVGTHYAPGGTRSRVLRFTVRPEGESPRIEFKDGATFEPGFFCPWVAVLFDNVLFSSSFNDNPDPLDVFVYNPEGATWGPTDFINRADEPFPLYTQLQPVDPSTGQPPRFSRQRIQGGDFSPSGHFYLLSDMPDAQGGGIYGFDLVSGCQILYRTLTSFDGDADGIPESDGGQGSFPIEYQDLEIVAGVTPGTDGVLHVLIHNNDVGTDNISILHIDVPDRSKI